MNCEEIGKLYNRTPRAIETAKKWYMKKIIEFLESEADDRSKFPKNNQKANRIRKMFLIIYN